MKRSLTLLLLLISLATLALAHANEQHVMGIVTKISGSQITVKTADNQSVTVTATDKTEFSKGDAKATFSDLKVGDRVVIHAMKKGAALEAHIVKFTTPASAGSKSPSKP